MLQLHVSEKNDAKNLFMPFFIHLKFAPGAYFLFDFYTT